MSTNKKAKNKNPGKKKFHGLRFLTILLAVAVGFELVFGVVGLVGINTMLESEPEMKLEDFTSQQSTLIYDSLGNQIADVGTQLRENVTYDQIPEALVDAFLSVEDSRYFTHNGFDIPRFASSVINTVIRGDMQGGSTFTMQLVKMTYFQNDEDGTSRTKDIEYKIQQIDLAMQLEKVSNKKQIFELYMNKMNFGGIGNIRGVQKAAQQYYGKSVSELNISECAMLAGVVNSPYYYDPHNYLDHATSRRNTVLQLMLYHGYINQQQYDLAVSVNVEDLLIDARSTLDSNGYQYQAYIDEAINEAQDVTGLDPLTVSMKIYTAMDPDVQDVMEEICAGENPNVTYTDDLMEVGIIAENNQTGEIVAIGGGRNYAAGGSMLLNHATNQYKQPGSSVKPFLDYALAFEYCGWATTHQLVDKAITYGNWTYKNANGQYHGAVNLMDAVSYSYNTPAIQALQAVLDEVGTTTVTDYLSSLGFTGFTADQFSIGFAIGGNDFICTAEELMAAHAILMNGGLYIEPHTITKIEYRSGNQEDFVPQYTGTQVLSSAAAYMTAQLMEFCVSSGYANYMTILQRSFPVYAKTGTTDWGNSGLQYGIPEGAMKDKWMVAETTDYTMAVWVGWEKAEAGAATYFNNARSWLNIPGHILDEVLDALYPEGSETPSGVQMPDGVSYITHISGIFPYVAPTSSIPSNMISTGLIKSEYNRLSTFSESVDALYNLESFTAGVNDENTLALYLNWTDYPDPSKLTIASSTDVTFDISWITGPVVYVASVSQNGVQIGTIQSSSSTTIQTVEGMQYDTDTTVCGYYAYSSGYASSDQVCIGFRTPSDPDDSPSYDDDPGDSEDD